MSVTKFEIRPGAYYDSIVLMQLQRALTTLPGVLDAGVVMATPTNLALLAEGDLLPDPASKTVPDDLLIVVRARNGEIAAAALAQVSELLSRRRTTTGSEFRPLSLETAVKALPNAGWVLVSVPGKYAAGLTRQAIDLDLHVFLYSNNVSLQDEIDLKQTARSKGLLVMGPDCGTAIINGVGLGFANRVRPGSIGLVGASGTGLQAITVQVHELGAGISHAIGTGGRDLKAEVGAITASQSLDLLARDSQTKVIVLVSKPPEPEVASRLLAAAQTIDKPVVVNFIGYPPPAQQLGNLHFASGLLETASLAVRLSHEASISTPNRKSKISNGFLRGLFSGGTLAYEALLGLQATLTPLYSNLPLHESQRLTDLTHSQAHTIIDLGADEFTVGRLHPMIDNDLRLRRLRQEAADSEVGVILLDIVLGDGAHPDPASELAPAIAGIKQARDIEVVAILIGTDDDPQNAPVQADRLTQAGAIVFRNTSDAVEYVSSSLRSAPAVLENPVSLESFQTPLAAINVGLESFYESLLAQEARAVHVEWRPPAGGNDQLLAILAKLKK